MIPLGIPRRSDAIPVSRGFRFAPQRSLVNPAAKGTRRPPVGVTASVLLNSRDVGACLQAISACAPNFHLKNAVETRSPRRAQKRKPNHTSHRIFTARVNLSGLQSRSCSSASSAPSAFQSRNLISYVIRMIPLGIPRRSDAISVSRGFRFAPQQSLVDPAAKGTRRPTVGVTASALNKFNCHSETPNQRQAVG